ncbi:hypothetical protein M2139_002013 [Enterococcus sp. PF1-24]|uniref:hypothetical protein n=1 Tax=unclassified Enterococcus TaxID=2608891 RepID=UPI00247551A3|nr:MULTISPECIES: hypothetical protein [unclassified Enterococcus]MDH6365012.1 hypothetical protein [Enterococcus sp. PFB1-1]MDH6402113.1 hypothetical protein [Enterococcus sp. PF1-24]
MSILSMVMIAFIISLYLFLILVRREILIAAKQKRGLLFICLLLAAVMLFLSIVDYYSIDDLIQGGVMVLLIFSFLLERRGLTEEQLVVNPLHRTGIPYEKISKIIVRELPFMNGVQIIFFKEGRRGFALNFDQPVTELLAFLKSHLPKTTEVQIMG